MMQETKGDESEMARALKAAAMAGDNDATQDFHSPSEEKKSRHEKYKEQQKAAGHRSEAFDDDNYDGKDDGLGKGDAGGNDHVDKKAAASELEKAVTDLNLDANIGDVGEDGFKVTFKIFDLGGQPTFYIFHPFFLTKYERQSTTGQERKRRRFFFFFFLWSGNCVLCVLCCFDILR